MTSLKSVIEKGRKEKLERLYVDREMAHKANNRHAMHVTTLYIEIELLQRRLDQAVDTIIKLCTPLMPELIVWLPREEDYCSHG